jgi:hypothetical protein
MGFSIIPSPPDLTRAQGTQTRSNIDGTFHDRPDAAGTWW